MQIIELEQVGKVAIIKSKRAKRLILKIDHKGRPVATIPYYLSYQLAARQLKKHVGWFLRHQPPKSVIRLEPDQHITPLHTIKFKHGPKVAGRLKGAHVIITFPPQLSYEDELVQEAALKACERAVRAAAEQLLPAKLHKLATRHGYIYKNTQVKKMRSRWGSCSSQKSINLNMWLVQLHEDLVEYVICHELVHLHHQNHQGLFWQELAVLLPDYKTRRASLKAHRPSLSL